MEKAHFYVTGEKLLEGTIKAFTQKTDPDRDHFHLFPGGASFVFTRLADAYYDNLVVHVIVDERNLNPEAKSLKIVCTCSLIREYGEIVSMKRKAEKSGVQAVYTMLGRFCAGYKWTLSEVAGM